MIVYAWVNCRGQPPSCLQRIQNFQEFQLCFGIVKSCWLEDLMSIDFAILEFWNL